MEEFPTTIMGGGQMLGIRSLRVVVVCKHDDGEQRRKHRKRRINKKWLKRYGVYSELMGPNQIAVIDGTAYMSRPTFIKMKAACAKGAQGNDTK